MRLSRKVLDAYNAAIKKQGDNAENAARKALEAWFEENPDATVAEAREFAVVLMDEVGSFFGNAAGDIAYALRDMTAEAAGVELPTVDYEYSPEAEYVSKAAHYQAGKLVDGDRPGFADGIASSSRYFAERGANDTMAALGAADGKRLGKRVRFARVPTGATNCPYCLMLASRGFVYKSELSALNANHPHCDCRIVEGFDGMQVEGYDPDEYYDRWKHPERYDQPEQDQTNPSPPVNIATRTTETDIRDAATKANPNYNRVQEALDKRNAKVAEINAMPNPTTPEEWKTYSEAYKEFQALDKVYKRLDREWKHNCQRAVVAYELRRRGYDVEAKRRLAKNDVIATNWKHLFVSQRYVQVGDSDKSTALMNLENEISSYGDGARSIVYVAWKNGGAHVFIAERQNGKIIYVDPQSGTVDYDGWQQRINPEMVMVSRVDDKELYEPYLDMIVKVNK